MESEDIFVLQKIIAIDNYDWSADFISYELDLPISRIERSLDRLRESSFLDSNLRTNKHLTKLYFLNDLHYQFPARPGKLGRGILTGAKPGTFFCVGLPYTSIWIWPKENGPDLGYEITPLSPGCCFAVQQDEKLRKLLAITETLRVAGPSAREWAKHSFKQIGLF